MSSATLPWQHEKPSQEVNLDTTMTPTWPIRFPKSKLTHKEPNARWGGAWGRLSKKKSLPCLSWRA